MLFNSIDFLFFFPLVVALYFIISPKYRWTLLLAASYYFYMCWKPEYIVLIIISTLIDYYSARKIGSSKDPAIRKLFLSLSLLSNLGILFCFKYLNFFSDSTRYFLDSFNIMVDIPYFDYLLPVGISFYTFQTLSYTIDVYRGDTKPETHLGIFALYVSFFPQLVAGPIERSTHLLPQFREKFKFDYIRIREGLMLMLWGFFKKVVIADRLAWFVNEVYNDVGSYEGFTIILATYFFAFQIYCDFSGYSDIAIGTAKVMGYDLMDNFRRPYFSRSVSEFWRRWHISLSTWFRDYLYIPLGGNRRKTLRVYFNLNIVFLLSGLWHGAAWTLVIWGGMHGFYLSVAQLFKQPKARLSHFLNTNGLKTLNDFIDVFITFHLIMVTWVMFRANSLSDALLGYENIMNVSWSQLGPFMFGADKKVELFLAIFFILVLETIHLFQERYPLRRTIAAWPLPIRWFVYIVGVLVVIFFGVFTQQQFIYFQF